mgnify:CR=1 FL=1
MKVPRIETCRLILAPMSLEYAPDVQENFENYEIVKHLSSKASLALS